MSDSPSLPVLAGIVDSLVARVTELEAAAAKRAAAEAEIGNRIRARLAELNTMLGDEGADD